MQEDGGKPVCPVCSCQAASPGGPVRHGPAGLAGAGVVSGQRLGRYEIIDEIGRGGMGVVCRARDLSSGVTVAVKLLPPGLHTSRGHVRSFLHEAEAVQRLRHRGIAMIHEVGCHGGRYYFSMDLVAGRSLASIVKAGTLLPEEAARLISEAARAVAAAHRAGIVHRDINPRNIMVRPDGSAVVLDFGLSAFFGEPDEHQGLIVGTPAYMSPEQAWADPGEPVGPGADVYSLGAVLYEAVTGRPPYSGVDGPAVVARVLAGAPPPPRTFSPGLSPRLEGVILKAMARRCAARYGSADALADDLELYRVGDSVRAARPGLAVALRSRLWRLRRRLGRWLLPAFCVLAGLALLAGLCTCLLLWALRRS
jgi:serine/threonine-protein kinase